MKLRLLISVDAFGESQIDAIVKGSADWLTWERVSETAPAAEFRSKLAAAEIVIGWPEPEWLPSSPVRLLLCPSVGYEQYLGQGLEAKQNFTFCNAGGVYSEGIAEHCLAMMLSLTRRLPHYIRAMQTRTWEQFPGHAELGGATVCIVGLGGIGGAIARRCHALGMNVIGVNRVSTNVPDIVQTIYLPDQLQEAVAKGDHVVAAVPGGKSTLRMFNRAVFDAMKPGAYFYNVGRGSAVDEAELVRHLQSGHLAGAGLDVFVEEPLPQDSPLWAMDNVIVTPHMAGFTADYANRLCALFAENLRRYHEDRPLLNVIDLGRTDT